MSEFDFDAHREVAVAQYRSLRPAYQQLAEVGRRILSDILQVTDIRFHSVEARAKTLESFGVKAAKPSESDPAQPKYPDPLRQITDLAGIRVITFSPRTLEQICRHIEQEFTILERTDKAAELMDEGKFGYQSIHFIVEMHPNRVRLPEYRRHRGLAFEIQVRTILQHAWAEMEHDIQYKSAAVIPTAIRRKFFALAGLLEIADREFQALQDEDETIRQQARASVQVGQLESVEITPDALKSYLDKKLGPDGRMTNWSYDFAARILRRLGFENLSQVDECLLDYDDDRVGRVVSGSRQGQLSRFEDTLLAAMGEHFVSRHPWAREDWWVERCRRSLDNLQNAGIRTGAYDPTALEAAKPSTAVSS